MCDLGRGPLYLFAQPVGPHAPVWFVHKAELSYWFAFAPAGGKIWQYLHESVSGISVCVPIDLFLSLHQYLVVLITMAI